MFRTVLLAVFAAALFVACNRESPALLNATAMHPAGREVFERYNCMRCHVGGEGGYGKRMVDNPDLRDLNYIKSRIRNGKRVGAAQMPAFKEMSQQELEDVAQFVRVLAGAGR